MSTGGYWGTVGVVADERHRRRFAARGIDSIEPTLAFSALERQLAHGVRQAVLVPGTAEAQAALGVIRRTITEDRGPVEADDALAPLITAPSDPVHIGRLQHHRSGFALLDRLAAALLRRRLDDWLDSPWPDTVPVLADELAVIPEYRNLFVAALDMLHRRNEIRLDGDEIHLLETASVDVANELNSEHADLMAHVRLLEAGVDGFIDVISGAKSAVEILFPGGSTDLVEDVYRGQWTADFFHAELADRLVDSLGVESGSELGPLRILEVGAGTGSATGHVLERLRQLGRPVEFVYTDVSRAFLRRGERSFGRQYPFVRFEVLDIERPPEDQGFPPGLFHAVLATNVLHTTADVGLAVRHAASLLAPGGALLVNEVTREV